MATRKDENKMNKERRRYGEEFLEKNVFCNGKPIIVKGKFDIRSKEENKLIFYAIRPYIEQVKTPKIICDELVFPVDTLWKVRILQSAVHKESFYIIGHIEIIYENRRPKGIVVLAEDIFPFPIMSASQFNSNFYEFENKCYKWPAPGQTNCVNPAEVTKVKRPLASLLGNGGVKAHLNQLKSRRRLLRSQKNQCQRSGQGQSERHQPKMLKMIETNNKVETEKPATDEIEPIRQSDVTYRYKKNQDILISRNNQLLQGKRLDESVQMASQRGFLTIIDQGLSKENNRLAEEKSSAIGKGEDVKEEIDEMVSLCNSFDSPIGRQWLREFNTREETIKCYECLCELINGIIYISNEVENWQIRYSTLYEKMILFHQNKRKISPEKDRSFVKGYHIQYVPDFRGPETIKGFVLYAYLHKKMIENEKEHQKKRRKNY